MSQFEKGKYIEIILFVLLGVFVGVIITKRGEK